MKPLEPGATIGIIGGGQLGRMSAMAAARLGFKVHIYTDRLPSPAGDVACFTTLAAYDDTKALEAFARTCDVITFEFENISLEGLKALERHCPVFPSSRILEISQNRITEKQTLSRIGLPVAQWKAFYNTADLLTGLKDFETPCIVKTARLGYDGKGQVRLSSQEALDDFLTQSDNLAYPLVAEQIIDFEREISVMVARDPSGFCRCYDPTENIHKEGILRVSLAPAPIMTELAEQARFLATTIAEKLELVGIMGVEMFHDETGKLLVNEIAPRPHNSGHWTMNGCAIDQFEMHIRAVTGLPLPSTRRHSDIVMHNLIGPDDMALIPQILREDECCLHLYGKEEAKPGRKMGHVNRVFPRGGLPGKLVLSQLSPPCPYQI